MYRLTLVSSEKKITVERANKVVFAVCMVVLVSFPCHNDQHVILTCTNCSWPVYHSKPLYGKEKLKLLYKELSFYTLICQLQLLNN